MATVVGYHGCEKSFAAGVRLGRIGIAAWNRSQNAYDWLGEGVYFWEASRTRAMEWAVEKFGDQADVLEAEIELGDCLSLLESTHHNGLLAAYRQLRADLRRRGLTMPRNHKKLHDLDNLVINDFVRLKAVHGIRFQTVRGVFEEGRPVFPGSAILKQSHIQVAVRDFRCIRIR